MLTVEVPAWGRVLTGYRTQVTAHLSNGHCVYLGEVLAKTPRLALRWLRGRARHVADQLDPPYARPLLAWLRDDREQQWALDGLARGEAYVVRASDEEGTFYVLSAEPSAVSTAPRSYEPGRKMAHSWAA